MYYYSEVVKSFDDRNLCKPEIVFQTLKERLLKDIYPCLNAICKKPEFDVFVVCIDIKDNKMMTTESWNPDKLYDSIKKLANIDNSNSNLSETRFLNSDAYPEALIKAIKQLELLESDPILCSLEYHVISGKVRFVPIMHLKSQWVKNSSILLSTMGIAVSRYF